MSIEAVSYTLGLEDIGDPTRKIILIGYANHAHRDGRNTWASPKTIATYACCSVRTVQRHLAALVAGGYMREGDQQAVSGIPTTLRPIVYDIAMDAVTRARWRGAPSGTRRAASAAQGAEGGRRGGRRGGAVSARVRAGVSLAEARNDVEGCQSDTRSPVSQTTPPPGVTGDTPPVSRVTPKPSVEPSLDEPQTPLPPSSAAPQGADAADEDEKPKRGKRGTRLPGDWQPSPKLRAWTVAKGLDRQRAHDLLEEFRDYWGAQTGARATRGDWDAVWRNRVRAVTGTGGQPARGNGRFPGQPSRRQEPNEEHRNDADFWTDLTHLSQNGPPS